MRKIPELATYFRKKGLIETWKRGRSRYLGVRTFILYKRDLFDGFKGTTLDGNFSCVRGNLNLLTELREKRKDLPREFYIDQTHGGDMFYLVYCKNEVAYIHWIFKRGQYSRFFNIKNDKTVELNYNITLPQFRGHRLQTRSVNFICEDLKEQGYTSALGAIAAGNILAQKGMAGTGFKEIGKVKSYFSYVKKMKVV